MQVAVCGNKKLYFGIVIFNSHFIPPHQKAVVVRQDSLLL